MMMMMLMMVMLMMMMIPIYTLKGFNLRYWSQMPALKRLHLHCAISKTFHCRGLTNNNTGKLLVCHNSNLNKIIRNQYKFQDSEFKFLKNHVQHLFIRMTIIITMIMMIVMMQYLAVCVQVCQHSLFKLHSENSSAMMMIMIMLTMHISWMDGDDEHNYCSSSGWTVIHSSL